MKKNKTKQFKLIEQYNILSNGAAWSNLDFPINRFKFKEKDWKNHYIWAKKKK